jgi:hypothetical protein
VSVTIRLAKPSDWPLIQRFHAEQNEAHGTNYALTPLFDAHGEFARNVAMAFIIEKDGRPVSSFYFELVPEVCFAGCDPQATAVARREIERIGFALRSMGFTGINCKVPMVVGESIRTPLEAAGFGDETGKYLNFFRDVRLPFIAAGEHENE